ncbi:MAG: hypothetical protein F4X98_12540 [Gammaproteobacteria bacterium]|nr:hypothetical protein [Gammaproteobacteria bacterium]
MVRIGLSILAAVAAVGVASAPADIDCSDVFGRLEISTVLEKRKQVRIHSFFESLAAEGYSAQQREFIADIAGVVNPHLGAAPTGLRIDSELPSPPADFADLPEERVLDTRTLVAEGQLDELAALAADDPTLARSHFAGYSLAALSVLQSSGTPADTLDRLIDAGFEFGLHELAFAIAHDVPVTTLEHLLDRTDADLAESWTDTRNNRPMDLAGLAAAKSRLGVLDALLRREPDPKASRAMDYLPVPSDTGETAAAGILKRLAETGYRPMLPSTADRLRTWVPDAMLGSLPLATALPGLTAEARDAGERFQREVLGLDAELATTRDQEARCRAADAGESADSGSLLAKRGTGRGVPSDIRRPGGAEIAALFRRQVTDPEAVEAREMMTLTSYVPWPHAPRPWDDFVQYVEDLPEEASPRIRYAATHLALASAPYDVLAKTLELAGGLPEDAVAALALRYTGDTVEVMEKLGEHGLDVHYVSPQGMNAVSAAARSMVSLDTLDYLLDRGVPATPASPGFDPLDYVLLNLITQPEIRTSESALPWIKKLIDHGVSVEASHLQLMELLRLDRPDTYADIVRTVRELDGPS